MRLRWRPPLLTYLLDAMAGDINSALELDVKHTEDAEQHRDPTLPGLGPMANDPADPDRVDDPHSAPPVPPPPQQAPWSHLSNACSATTPLTNSARAPSSTGRPWGLTCLTSQGQGLQEYTTDPAPGAHTQEWEGEYAVDVSDMTTYVENVEDLGQDTILSLLVYHSWRSGPQLTDQITLHRPQREPHQWAPEQTAKRSIILHLIPEGFYILKHSGLPNAAPYAQSPPLTQHQEDNTGASPSEDHD